MSNNNYPPNSHYMPQMNNQQLQQQMQQQSQQNLYGMQMGMHKLPDGTIQNHQQQMMMQQQTNINQRPPQRVMMINQPQHQYLQQQQQHRAALMQMQQGQKQVRMINQAQGMQSTQAYYAAGPGTRAIGQSPMKISQQIPMRTDGMRPQQISTGHVVRQSSSYDTMQIPQSGSVIVQQGMSQQMSQTGNQQYRTIISQGGGPIKNRPPTQIIRTSDGRCVIRPQQNVAYAVPSSSSSGEPTQYQILNQQSGTTYVHQGSNQGQIRTVRPTVSQPQQTQQHQQIQQSPLQMALARPTTQVVTTQSNVMMQSTPIVVIQQNTPSTDTKPYIVDQTGPEVRVISGNQTTQMIRQQVPQTIQVKQVPVSKPISVPFNSNSQTAIKTTPNKTIAKTPAKKATKTKGKVGVSQNSQPKMADTSDTMGSATSKSKLISSTNFERILSNIGVIDSIDSNAKSALAEFAESYADDLIAQLVAAAKHRKVNKIENKDAQYVLSQEKRRDHPNEYRKR